MGIIKIENNGREITQTNYFQTENALNGYFYLSVNRGAFRLLVPRSQETAVPEFQTAKEIIISRGNFQGRDALEILFDDETDNPFSIHIVSAQIDRMPAANDAGWSYTFSAWTSVGGENVKKIFEQDCFYRVVKNLPFLEPLRGGEK